MKEKFVNKRFSNENLNLIKICDGILSEYRAQGYRLSLRQLYYQLVARDHVENNLKSYSRVGNVVSDARLAGLLDWEMIEDRGREVHQNSHWKNPAGILRSAAYSFRMDKWVGQENYVEVFVEKDALSGILLPVCQRLDVKFTANKGYSSSSAMYEAAKRITEAGYDERRNVHIIYLGDHDPSGIDMTRDIRERFTLFTRESIDFEVHRLALNYDQVEMWNPPKNPAKQTDSRYESYVKEFGESSWELDAVEPEKLAKLVSSQIDSLIDFDLWDEIEEKENEYKNELKELAARYE